MANDDEKQIIDGLYRQDAFALIETLAASGLNAQAASEFSSAGKLTDKDRDKLIAAEKSAMKQMAKLQKDLSILEQEFERAMAPDGD